MNLLKITSLDAPIKSSLPNQDMGDIASVGGSFKIVVTQIHEMLVKALQILPLIILACIVFIIFLVIAKLVKEFIKHITIKRSFANVGLVLARLTQWAIIFIGFFITLVIIFPSLSFANLLGGLGIVSVIAGLAFKDILHNYLAGILILLKKPFTIGDELHFLSTHSKDYYGKVEHIDTRYTFLKSFDGRRILIPNGEIYTNVVVINTTYGSRRSQQDVTIGPYAILHPACKTILEGIKSVDGVMAQPAPEALLMDLAPNAMVVRLRWWTKPERRTVLRVKSEILDLIQAKLIESRVNIPFPTQITILQDPSKANYQIDGVSTTKE
ncbi:mechanosensitive ion channel domain-containing protein [Candidatus Berkiella aquae]|uniref:Small-conductance mechanosensitive channel n=1 Tax=Candidatus Berkiella aquae TaxID=295108 RepID=A0A0Q9YLY9_9GAMM|nr:mechanosensitive ion channel family protein [Candidatus Berkiella aquae]MCS5711334.1 mechanosensitive ion channel family protein [Candidatus Berkiella aquae]